MEYTDIIFVRHGETEANSTHTFAGITETPLTALGVRQAEALGETWKNEHFDLAFCSDLSRAVKTAELVLKHHPELKAVRTPELREWNLGEYEGVFIPPLFVSGSDFRRKWNDQSLDFTLPGGESRFALRRRIAGFTEKCAAANPGKRILFVSHGAITQQFFMNFTGVLPSGMLSPMLSNTGTAGFRYFLPTKEWMLLWWNNTSHLAQIGEHATL